MIVTRPGVASDLAEIAAVQSAAPEAAQWNPADYLACQLFVATLDSAVVGFLVSRLLAGSEYEILNLAVAPHARRRGVARALLQDAFSTLRGTIFLEVRASNLAALQFYESIGFQQLSRRENYYSGPSEAAIVMKFHSC